MCTINTHLGLLKVTRLFEGIASAPAIGQRCMDSILGQMKNVANLIDATVMTGKNDDEHLEVVDSILTKMEKRGMRLGREKCSFL